MPKFDLNDPSTKQVFLSSFRKNYPELCYGRTISICVCTNFKDAEHDKALREHTGHHPKILKEVAKSQFFDQVNHDHIEIVPNQDEATLTINVCQSGRHRSVANSIHQKAAIESIEGCEDEVCEIVHLSEIDYWRGYCGGNCKVCDDINQRPPAGRVVQKKNALEMSARRLNEAHPLGSQAE